MQISWWKNTVQNSSIWLLMRVKMKTKARILTNIKLLNYIVVWLFLTCRPINWQYMYSSRKFFNYCDTAIKSMPKDCLQDLYYLFVALCEWLGDWRWCKLGQHLQSHQLQRKGAYSNTWNKYWVVWRCLRLMMATISWVWKRNDCWWIKKSWSVSVSLYY